MNIKSLAMTALIIPGIILLPGCGPRRKSLLNKLSTGMSKDTVTSRMGQPDQIRCPLTDRKGNVIDIWEYNLATVDENKENRRVTLQLCGWLLFWPCLCFPAAWDTGYDYDTYLLKFVNHLLAQWGKESEMGLPHQEH